MSKSKEKNRIAYQEFGDQSNSQAFERSIPEFPPNQQNLRVQTSRSGRAGKTVTIVTGFQCQTETLTKLLKQLKAACGTGGTVKENTIEIQGDNRQKILQILIESGYKAKISGG
ncbi:MAG: translation initiation factor [Microcystis viridis Mv_BB_P_19951000_S69]|uniref:Translation initiation factor n=1 Tax=Microcystis viridis Mv_BB_P_19951000_S68D TaxID=2486270 RepID=A0A552H5F5_MICVR|nr:MAG: translation initiation factor [Microcystis viridis Mv_BB_P_19951000_S68D]TRU77867.1 MAG: translation initiation factor [Microcystis viridis Mv_BB_P_19951000_S69]TRU84196.1 MAG: translation initiation factor [Microcystis viridis Mv_BB_P_19951000_S69D]